MKDETVSYDPHEETKNHYYSDSSSISYRAKSSHKKTKTLNARVGVIEQNLSSKRTRSNNKQSLKMTRTDNLQAAGFPQVSN